MGNQDFVNEHIYGAHLNPGDRVAYNANADYQWRTERMYIRKLTELCMARFDWKGLPTEVPVRFVEKTLMEQAVVIFCKLNSELYGDRYFALKGAGAGRIDPYDNPTQYQILANGYFNMRLRSDECVPIWANDTRVPDWDVIQIFAAKLAHIDRSITIAEKNMRNTNVVFTTENGKLSAQNFQKQRDDGELTVFVKKGAFDPEDITAIDMKVHPDTLPKLMLAKSKHWNEAMTLLGINNANQDKAERVQAAEVAANDDQINVMRRVSLNERQRAAEKINEKYGLNVSVDFHEDEAETETVGGGADYGAGNDDLGGNDRSDER